MQRKYDVTLEAEIQITNTTNITLHDMKLLANKENANEQTKF